MIKKCLALFLATTMIFLQVPIIAHGASSAMVNRVASVLVGNSLNAQTAPVLVLEETSPGEFKGQQDFRLILTNGVWPEDIVSQLQSAVPTPDPASPFQYQMAFSRIGDDELGVTATITSEPADTKQRLQIPLICSVQESGVAQISVMPRDSVLSPTTVVFAQGVVPGIRGMISDVPKLDPALERIPLGDIIVDELVSGSMPKALTISSSNDAYTLDLSKATFNFAGSLRGCQASYTDGQIKIEGTSAGATKGSLYIRGAELVRVGTPAPSSNVSVLLSGNGLAATVSLGTVVAPVVIPSGTSNTVNFVLKTSNGMVDSTNAPLLTVKEKGYGVFEKKMVFRLNLSNAEWIDNAASQLETLVPDVTTGSSTYDIRFDRVSNTEMEITVDNYQALDSSVLGSISIPLLAKFSQTGTASVSLDARDTRLTSGTNVFADVTVPEYGITVAPVSIARFDAQGYAELAPIHIQEKAPQSILNRKFTVALTNERGYGFESTNGKVEFVGGITGEIGGTQPPFSSGTKQEITITQGSATTPGEILLTGIRVKAAKNAPLERIQLKLSGTALNSTVVLPVALNNGTLRPTAKTESYVDTVKNVVPGYGFSAGNTGKYGDAPRLVIGPNGNTTWTGNQKIALTLTNGVWQSSELEVLKNQSTDIQYRLVTETLLEVSWNGDNTSNVEIPLVAKVNQLGAVRVSMNPMDSKVSARTLQFASVMNPGTVTDKQLIQIDPVKIGKNTVEFLIQENAPNAITNQVTLKLPRGYAWDQTVNIDPLSLGASVDTTAFVEDTLTINLKDAGTWRAEKGSLSFRAGIIPLNTATTGVVNVLISGQGLGKEKVMVGNYTKPQSSGRVTIASVGKVGPGIIALDTMTLQETLAGSLKLYKTEQVRLVLPSGYTWASAGNGEPTQGNLSSVTTAIKGTVLTVSLKYNPQYGDDVAGHVALSGLSIKKTKKSVTGPVRITLSGAGLETKELIVAQ